MAVHPDNAMALAMWIDATVHLGCVAPEHQGENGDESLARMAERAVELNSYSDYVFYARASLRLMRLGDSSGALEDGRRSVELSPNFSWGFSIMGQALVCLGRADEAIELLKRAESLSDSDPWKPYHSGVLALAQFLSGDLDGSLSNIDSLINLHPGVWTHHRLKAAILEQKKDMAGAERSRDHAMKYSGTPHILANEFPLPARYREMLRQ